MFRPLRFAVLLAPLLLSGCGFLVIHGVRHAMSAYSNSEAVDAVEAGLARYREWTLAGKTDQLPDLFDVTGEVLRDDQAPIAGRPALTAFFKSHAGYKVLDYDLRATSTKVNGDLATQKGRFDQKAVTPAGQTVNVQGTFEAAWARQSDGRWLIHRLQTTSAARG